MRVGVFDDPVLYPGVLVGALDVFLLHCRSLWRYSVPVLAFDLLYGQ